MADHPPNPDIPPQLQLLVKDHTGNKAREVKIVADVPVRDLLPALITAMRLPVTDPAGRPIVYHLAANEQQLPPEATLAGAGVEAGATLNIVPEMTAGRELAV